MNVMSIFGSSPITNILDGVDPKTSVGLNKLAECLLANLRLIF